ncbi:TetR/AcrR family transcriptional regulator [Clostridium sp. 19966]|uniref:TetR/AcrR family transcriptional regulator n=1 Tax=Clostridium sp. 19966 TaxID=2768166 RepID=UPI0028E07E9E|nr:TetR/AcrR family transcriptional regulator [Clostridium sp. 19966]MDT8719187.1 TetR/AcrR family transcriptional regulator [Clostridium sp. 19966]
MRKKDDLKQKCIKEAVVQLILEEGLQGTSISKIAKAAGISPATVYIYYENKDTMLREIYTEYAEDMFQYVLRCISPSMGGKEIIAEIIRRYYNFIVENKEVFYFIVQYSSCPILNSRCGAMKGPEELSQLLTDLKDRHIFNNYNNDNLYAVLFSTVEMIAIKSCELETNAADNLEELIAMIQKLCLKDL